MARKNWLDMNAGNWHAKGTQLDMLSGIDGDGCGTLDLLAYADELPVQAPVVALPWAGQPAQGILFGNEQLVIGL